jgi:hypothetical protein
VSQAACLRSSTRAGVRWRESDVSRHGLPKLPEVLTYEMSIPVAFWTSAACAVVLFVHHSRQPGESPDPVVSQGGYYRDGDRWRAHPHWTGSGWSHDPISKPGDVRDLGGQAILADGGSFTGQPRPGRPAITVTGRVSPAVTAIALVRDGQEDRRPLRSHFGAWVVCLEQWSPCQVKALDKAGAVIGSVQGRLALPWRRWGSSSWLPGTGPDSVRQPARSDVRRTRFCPDSSDLAGVQALSWCEEFSVANPVPVSGRLVPAEVRLSPLDLARL